MYRARLWRTHRAEAAAGLRRRQHVDELARRSGRRVHHARPGLEVVCLRQHRAILQAEFVGENRGVLRAHSERDDRAGVAEHGLPQALGNWPTCWFAATNESLHLRASERMDAKLSVAKFWNSSTIQGEVATFVFGDVLARLGRLGECGDEETRQEDAPALCRVFLSRD